MRILEELWYGNINPQGPDSKKEPRMERHPFLFVKNNDCNSPLEETPSC